MVMSLNLCKKNIHTRNEEVVIMKSVRNKLVSLALVVILIPTLLVGVVSYFIAKSELDATGQMGLKNGASAIISMITELDKQVEKG